MPGWKIPGYTGLRALGSGGFGDMVLARHDDSGILVAVKYLRRDLLADPGFAAMFRAEAEVLASLDDPNVVRLYEYIESPAGAVIVTELIDGVSVREILSDQGATTAEAALVVLQGSLLGLAATHARGVVHRDYKPENVLVNVEGVSKLTDFGIAARARDRPVPAGTLAYAPPEQFRGVPASPAGDVYATTATFYECLTGHPPFTGQTTEALLAQHRSEPVPLEAVPEPLRPLVTAGMAKDPGDRPDAAALVSELRTVAVDVYGQDWEDRGRSRLAEAVPLLAGLWPSGAAPAVQGAAVEQVNLPRSAQGSRQSRHLRHLRPEAHPRHLRRLRVAMAAAAAGAVVLVVVVTSGSFHSASGTSVRSASAASPGTLPPVVKLRPSAPVTASSPRSSLPPSPSPSSRGSAPPGYNEYANPRYGFTALRPSSFRAQPPPEDGDGQAWTSPDGQVLLAAYGTNNVLNYSPEQDEAADARLLSVVYVNISGDIVTVSGYTNNGRTIVYQRDVVGPGSIDTLYWSYPANQKAQLDTAVTQTALTFQPGNVTTAH
ncbi:MAG TPA: serine/threonine-protein kinase [Streptosporangiaceae bacterium]